MIGKCDVCKREGIEVFEIMNIHDEEICCCDDCWNSEEKWETKLTDENDKTEGLTELTELTKLTDIELLEVYSHYNKMPFVTEDEQFYRGALRYEILKRMGANKR